MNIIEHWSPMRAGEIRVGVYFDFAAPMTNIGGVLTGAATLTVSPPLVTIDQVQVQDARVVFRVTAGNSPGVAVISGTVSDSLGNTWKPSDKMAVVA